jgi:hypothetical protein
MWLYAGFLSLGSLAGELREPVRRSYVVALLILIPMVLLMNCMPLMVSMSLGAAPPPPLLLCHNRFLPVAIPGCHAVSCARARWLRLISC